MIEVEAIAKTKLEVEAIVKTKLEVQEMQRLTIINKINNRDGQIYFPFMYVLFIFILINNLIGMLLYSLASISHFILTFLLGLL
jgi:F0F1-type ATP synthase membrane subunit a